VNALALRLIPDATVRRVLSWVVPVGLVAFAVLVWPYPATLGVILNGALGGGRIALIALGIALVYRSNRIINFAAADMGVAPITLVVMLVLGLGWNYWLGLGIGIVGAVVVGVLTELVIIRRFRKAPRLILTVATIGVAQLLLVLALLIPGWISGDVLANLGDRLSPPFTVNWEFGGIIFNANDIVTMIAVPIALLALALFLTRSQTGMAVRAAAERGDRAAMLGIPVGRVQTIVWTIASLLAFLALFLRTGAVGLPIGSPLGPAFLIQAIGAAVIGRFERFPTIACASIAIGILDQANTFQPGNRPSFNDVMIFVIVLAALLFVRRATTTRAGDVSNWQTVDEVRPVPAELARLPEVRGFFWGIGALVLAFVLLVPTFLSEAKLSLATVIVIFAIVGVSLVVLTGWAGQVSLGQVAFMGIGGAVGGSLTSRLGWDISIAILVGGLVGAIVAVIIGYPAIRRRGLTLAVITLAFALVTQTYFLNREFFGDWLPDSRIERPALFGVIDINTETRFYYFSLVVLALILLAARGIRKSRTGRALIAIRENENAAQAYGIDAVRTTVAAFAISGFMAAVAGVLFVHEQNGLGSTVFAPRESLTAFSAVVIGGLGSLPGAVLGAVYVRGAQYFLNGNWQLVATGAGVLLILWIYPGGLGGIAVLVRDAYLRWVANRRGLVVPSLLRDERVAQPEAEPMPLPNADHGTEPERYEDGTESPRTIAPVEDATSGAGADGPGR
jgi:branched-chain amino acid transport system permease protein